MPLFVCHLEGLHRIPLSDALSDLPWIAAILVILTALSLKAKFPVSAAMRQKEIQDGFGIETGTTLKGIAVLFLIFGHLAIVCIEGEVAFEYAGDWAVVIFLFLSGHGLVKKYRFRNPGKKFMRKRVAKLMIPLWLTLLLFYVLDYQLLGKSYPWQQMVEAFLGILYTRPPNAPAWFITFILFLYGVFYLACRLPVSDFVKPFALLIIYLVLLCLTAVTPLQGLLKKWIPYLVVFPAAAFIAYHSSHIFKLVGRFHEFSRLLYFGAIVVLFLFFYRASGISILCWVLPVEKAAAMMEIIRPLYLISAVILTAYLLEIARFTSSFLTFLGLFSLEIFLIHLPFMESYDLFLVRKPLTFFFFVYLSVIIVLAFGLRRLTDLLGRLVCIFALICSDRILRVLPLDMRG
jgi:peptidoglycan/LPS O-acetylase OafA/YrhL